MTSPSARRSSILAAAIVAAALLAAVLFSSGAARAQSTVDSTLRSIESLYGAGSYALAELQARRLADNELLSDSVHVLAEQWIAFALVAQERPEQAGDHFRNILERQPEYELDPVLTSPKIIAVFTEARSAHRAAAQLRGGPTGDSPRSITYRTLLFPGWEQLHRGRSTPGVIFLGTGIAALGTGIALEFLRAETRSEYLAATVPADIASKYSTYNKTRKAEIWAFAAFAAVYLASQIDVVLNPPQ